MLEACLRHGPRMTSVAMSCPLPKWTPGCGEEPLAAAGALAEGGLALLRGGTRHVGADAGAPGRVRALVDRPLGAGEAALQLQVALLLLERGLDVPVAVGERRR